MTEHEEFAVLIGMRNNLICSEKQCENSRGCWDCEKEHKVLDMRFLSNFGIKQNLVYKLKDAESLYIMMTYPNMYKKYLMIKGGVK